MKLFKISVKHAAPKDSHTSVECFAIAEDEATVYECVDAATYQRWSEAEAEGETHAIYDEDWNEIGRETERERRMRLRGDIDDDEDWSDAYYGLTWYGWDEGQEIDEAQANVLLALGVAEDWRK